jgi:hypothetical protein
MSTHHTATLYAFFATPIYLVSLRSKKFLSNLFLKTLRPCSSLSLRGEVLHSKKRRLFIDVLCGKNNLVTKQIDV